MLVSASNFSVGGLKCFYPFNLSQAREIKLKIFHMSGLFLVLPNIYSVRVNHTEDEEGKLCLYKWRKGLSGAELSHKTRVCWEAITPIHLPHNV